MLKKILKEKYLFWYILALASFLRLYKLGEIPLGLNQDEAYAGYEAFLLLTYGHDSWGYHFPVYFTAWGSGMNVLYSYISIPFLALLGIKVWVLRLPQALFGLLSCYVFYRLLHTTFNRHISLLGFFLSAIIPWHIILSRWALESNIAPFFILTGLYFFARSIKKQGYLLLSALFYGIGLYAYATSWIYISLTFSIQLLYLLLYKKTKTVLLTILSAGAISTTLAFPLFLFILVNNNIVPEIKNSFISIPKLIYWRQNEIGVNDLNIKLFSLLNILYQGKDYLISNQIEPYGIFYPISIPFLLIGAYALGKRAYKELRLHQFSLSFIILISIVIGLIYSAILYPCINRLNFLWFNILILITIGIYALSKIKRLFGLILSLYICFGIVFAYQYFNKYNQLASAFFSPNLKPALDIAEQHHLKSGLPIIITEHSSIYSKILFYQKIPPRTFNQTIKYQKFPDAYLDAVAFAHYKFFPDFNYTNIPPGIYIAPLKQKYFFYQFNIFPYGDLLVAVPKT